jgi:hypothetical protein
LVGFAASSRTLRHALLFIYKLVGSNIEMTEITDKEMAKRLRENILNVLDLWNSVDKQLEYQSNVPIAQVSSELFNQWADFYYPDSKHFKIAFDKIENEILSDFDKLLNHISDKFPNGIEYISNFIKTNEWLILNNAAKDTINRLNNTAANKVYKK